MVNGEYLIFDKNDLVDSKKQSDIEDIGLFDFFLMNKNIDMLYYSDFIGYKDGGYLKILKNRYGEENIIVNIEKLRVSIS